MNYVFAAIFGLYAMGLAGYVYKDILASSKEAKARNKFLSNSPEDNRKDLRFL